MREAKALPVTLGVGWRETTSEFPTVKGVRWSGYVGEDFFGEVADGLVDCWAVDLGDVLGG